MKKVFGNKKFQIISIVIMVIIFIVLLFTKGIPFGIKIGTEYDKFPNLEGGIYKEYILQIYNVIIILLIILINLIFCICSKKKTINIIILTCFIIISLFMPVVLRNSYEVGIVQGREPSYTYNYNIIELLIPRNQNKKQ